MNPTDQPTPDASVPVIPDHELIYLIGRGSSGEVWLARNALGSYRAVKIVYEITFRHRRPYERELDGVRNTEPISRSHDGLVDILQVGLNDAAGYFYYVMELSDDVETGQHIDPTQYVPRTLSQDLAEQKRVPICECIRLGAAIASALSFLHRHRLIHRDIKPSNIIFVNGFPKLADIGLITETSSDQSRLGTEGFIPPEGPGTPQGDIYSLGKVLYEMSTGRDRMEYPALPSPLGDTAEDRDLIQFNKIMLKACRADVGRRYQSAEELLAALIGFQFCDNALRQERLRKRKRRILFVVGWLLGLGVFAAAVWRVVWLAQHHR